MSLELHYARYQRRSHRRAAVALVLGAVVAAVAGALVFGIVDTGNHHSAAAPSPRSTTTTSIGLAGAVKTWTAIENAKPGSPGWPIKHPSTNGQMEAYLNTVSAQRGDTVTLYASTDAPTWNAIAYRMGWYQGALAREVWRSGTVPGTVQPTFTREPATNIVSTQWAPSLNIRITSDFLPGDYLIKLTSSAGWDWYVPLTVRDDDSKSPILVLNSVTTWQAYNLWGGYDLYSGLDRAGRQSSADRATAVSFDRPYRIGDGSGDFLGNEARFVQLAEREGFDLSYTTDVDLEKNPGLLANHRLVVSLGHDEYYSLAMRGAMDTARARGTNLAFLGANAVYRHIRFQPSALGADRVEINYRSAAADPLYGQDNADVTVQWREAPNNRPESDLLGEMYQCNPVLTDFVVTDPTAWVFAGTGLAKSQHLKGLVGSEYDHYSSRDPQPPGTGVQLIARSPVVCRGRKSTADFSYYVAPSQAGIIDVGTNLWVPRLFDIDPVTAITITILREGQRGPLGRIHPAVDTPVVGSEGGTPPPVGET